MSYTSTFIGSGNIPDLFLGTGTYSDKFLCSVDLMLDIPRLLHTGAFCHVDDDF